MKLSAKTEYGIQALLDLASRNGDAPAHAKSIAQRQKIPHRFLEQVLNNLRKGGLIESIRGAQGGYTLARPASEIRISDVLEAVEGGTGSSPRSNGKPDSPFPGSDFAGDILSPVLRELEAATASILNRFTIEDLLNRKTKLEQAQTMMFHI